MGVHNPNLQTYTHVSYHCAKNKAKHIYPLAKFEKILLFLFEKVIGGFFISLLIFHCINRVKFPPPQITFLEVSKIVLCRFLRLTSLNRNCSKQQVMMIPGSATEEATQEHKCDMILWKDLQSDSWHTTQSYWPEMWHNCRSGVSKPQPGSPW